MAIEQETFEVDGRPLPAFRLRHASGVEARIAAWGGALLSLHVPDRDGCLDDVVLGYADPASYAANPSYHGVLVGRYANRIAGARYTIDGVAHALEANDGAKQLHGGRRGFSRVAWHAEPFERAGAAGVALEYTSPAGDGGHPGTLRARVLCTLTDDARLAYDWTLEADAPTHVNPTAHPYFNLARHDAGYVLAHVLELAANRFLPVDASLVPTGELRPVDDSPFDFRTPRVIGDRIHDADEQLRIGNGYDHCFVLDEEEEDEQGSRASRGAGTIWAARLHEPRSGRTLDVYTTEPGLQVYTGNWLADGVTGKGGVLYGPRAGVALEAQHFPDSPNRPEFPSTLLRPGSAYRSRTVYAFGVA